MNETPRKVQEGDKARVVIEGTVETLGTGGWMKLAVGSVPGDDNSVLSLPRNGSNITVEVLERADDPSKDPIGTRREMAEDDESRADSSPLGPYAVRWTDTGGHPWVWFRWDGPQLLADDTVRGWRKVDPMPGTPAMDAGLAASSAFFAALVEKVNASKVAESAVPGPLPCPVTPRTLADDSPLTLLRTAERIARDHGDTLRADRFEDAAKDHTTVGCRAGGPCTAERDARKALAEYGYDVNGVAW